MTPRENWSQHVNDIIRSRHYTWIAEGLGGQPLPEALTSIVTDVMHICRQTGLPWETLIAESRKRCEAEEANCDTRAVA